MAINTIEDFEEGAAAWACRRAMPSEVEERFPHRDSGTVRTHYYRQNPDKVAFVDKGDKLESPGDFDQQSVRAMVDIADARGWDKVKVNGSESFRRQAYLEAAQRGIEVKGYKPTEAERQFIEHARGQLQRYQKAADAFAAAADLEAKAAAARAHPELAKAYAIEAAAGKFAEQAGWSEAAKQRFKERIHETVGQDLRQGKKLERIEIRQRNSDRRRSAESVQER